MSPDASLAILHDPLFWITGGIAIFLLGMSKGGFLGVGSPATAIFALALPPVQAAAIILPLLLVQDVVSVWSFRHSFDRHVLKVMLPGVAIGILIAFLFAALVPERWVVGALGLISFSFGARRLWVERGGRIAPAKLLPDWVGFLCGIASGAVSQIAHQGGPPYQIWTLPRRMDRDVFVGTTAIFFASVNWMKVPAYAALGELNPTNLIASAALMPIAIASTFAGVWLVRKVDADRFYVFAYGLLTIVGIKLLWDAMS